MSTPGPGILFLCEERVSVWCVYVCACECVCACAQANTVYVFVHTPPEKDMLQLEGRQFMKAPGRDQPWLPAQRPLKISEAVG